MAFAFYDKYTQTQEFKESSPYLRDALVGSMHDFLGMPMDRTPMIGKACPCNEYPPKPHFYIVKLGFAGRYTYFSYFCSKT